MTSPTPIAVAQSIGDVDELAASWRRSLAAARLSPRTIQSYGESVRLLAEYLRGQGMPVAVASIRREHVEAFVTDQLARHAPATAAVRFASLRVFFNWLVAEGELPSSPMARMRKPRQPSTMVDVPAADDLKKLLASMAGDDFNDLRDTAILRVFLSTGARLSEVAGLRWDITDPTKNDIDLDARLVRFRHGKGDLERVASLSPKTVRALDRYERRARRRHPAAGTKQLWLGKKGILTSRGIAQMLRARSAAAGIRLHPHQLRHFRADRMLAAGMTESDTMALMGWRDPAMLRRYAASRRTDRALAAVRTMAEGDDI